MQEGIATAQVAVVVPWRESPDRRPLLDWVTARYPWPVILGEPPEGDWSKGAALADGLARCDAAVVVVADADVWCDGTADAVQRVAAGVPWAVPHEDVRRLSRDATRQVLNGASYTLRSRLQEPAYPGIVGGGLVVAQRAVLDETPIDPRFRGWGGEDLAWGWALTTLHGEPWRGTEPCWHLWHEPQHRPSRGRGSAENWRLLRQYRQAHRRPERMRALVRR